MTLEQSPINRSTGEQTTLIHLAELSDIPGTRCGPEDGPWPRSYQLLEEPDIWREMSAFAKPQSVILDPKQGYRADAINFQPCLNTRTQDRYVVQQLQVHGRTWTLTGVFDGKYYSVHGLQYATCHDASSVLQVI